MSIDETKLNRLQELLKIVQDSVTKKEFVDAFKAVYDFVKKIESKNNSELDNIKTQFSALSTLVKEESTNEVENLKSQVNGLVNTHLISVMKDFEKKSAEIDIKLAELKDGDPGKDGESVEIEEVISEVLKRIPEPPIDTPESIANKLETLKGEDRLDAKAIKNLPEFVENVSQGSGLRNVFHDSTLTGTGTVADPLSVIGGGGGAVDSVNGETGIVVLTTGDITEDTNANYVSDAQLTVIGNTSGTNTGDQDLSPYFNKSVDDTDDITVGATNKFATSAEKTKLGHITVTQAVDLDTLESDTATNNAKVSNATHTGEVTGTTTLTVDKTAITGKSVVTAVGTDYILISDTSDSGNLKKALASDLAGAGGVAWGGITGTLSDQTDLQTELDGKQDVITGLTASGAELNILDGATLTTTELNYVDGVTSNIQTQLNTKVDTTGTPANNYISVFTDADTIEGDTNFTWDGTTHTILGTSLLSKTGTATVGTPTYDSNSYKFQGSQWFTTGSVAKTLTGGLSMDLRETASVALGTINLGYSIDGGTERAVVSYKTGDHYNDGFTGQLTMRSGYTDGSTFSTGFGSGFGGVLETQYDGTFAFRPIGGASTDFSGMRALSFGTHATYASFWSRWGYGGGSAYDADIRTSFNGSINIGAGQPAWHSSPGAGASGSELLSVTIDQVITGNNASRPALRITKATEQLRLGYDASNYFQATVASTGSTTFNLVGTSPEFTFSDAVNVPDEAYGAGWNGNTEVPTKNAVYDQVELKAPLASPTFTGTVVLPTTTIGGVATLSEGASIALDPSLSADGTWSGITMTATAGYTQAFGDLVYLDPTDSRWEAVDANSASGADGDARGMLGMVVVAGTDGTACTILLQGIIRADAKFATFTINNPIYASETAGLITQTQPTTTDVVIRVIGFAITADEIYFNPSPTYITHT